LLENCWCRGGERRGEITWSGGLVLEFGGLVWKVKQQEEERREKFEMIGGIEVTAGVEENRTVLCT